MKDYNEIAIEITRVEFEIKDKTTYINKLMELRDRFADPNVPCEILEQRNHLRDLDAENAAYIFVMS